MSNSINNLEDSTKEAKNCTNNFTNNNILNNSFKPPNLNSQAMPSTAPNMQPKTNFAFPVLINPAVLNIPSNLFTYDVWLPRSNSCGGKM